jgi:uncharacterized membrane protein YdfJ with MMPL/SSD domain
MFSFTTDDILEKEQRQIFLRRAVRRVFYDDWLIKLFALLITLALWLGVTGLRADYDAAQQRNIKAARVEQSGNHEFARF